VNQDGRQDGREDGALQSEELRRAIRPYAVVVGVIFLAVIVFVSINTISHRSIGLKAGDRVARFAAPSATGTTNKDANVDPKKACDVHGADVVNICDYFDRPLVLTAWFSRCGGHCEPQLDRVEQIRRRFPGVAFVGLDVRDSLDKARRTVVKHGWKFPMALDRDGAVSALYGVVVGPTTFFIYPRDEPDRAGVLREAVRHELDARLLEAHVRALVRGARARERAQRRG
jgi:peroxiredoxin